MKKSTVPLGCYYQSNGSTMQAVWSYLKSYTGERLAKERCALKNGQPLGIFVEVFIITVGFSKYVPLSTTPPSIDSSTLGTEFLNRLIVFKVKVRLKMCRGVGIKLQLLFLEFFFYRCILLLSNYNS